jgi:hypothetical protein
VDGVKEGGFRFASLILLLHPLSEVRTLEAAVRAPRRAVWFRRMLFPHPGRRRALNFANVVVRAHRRASCSRLGMDATSVLVGPEGTASLRACSVMCFGVFGVPVLVQVCSFIP